MESAKEKDITGYDFSDGDENSNDGDIYDCEGEVGQRGEAQGVGGQARPS